LKAVVDTNVIVSAGLRSGTPPGAVVRAWIDARFEAITSEPLLRELETVVKGPRLAMRLAWSQSDTVSFIAGLRRRATIVAPTVSLRVVTEDPPDNRVLEAALTGQADYIVTGDQHLLELGEFEGVQIVTPARFVAVLAEHEL
jgi:hypothetical protein